MLIDARYNMKDNDCSTKCHISFEMYEETVLIQQGNIHNNIMLLLLKSVLIIIIIVHYLGECQIHYCLHL